MATGDPTICFTIGAHAKTAVWYLNNYQLIGNAAGPTVWGGWSVVAP